MTTNENFKKDVHYLVQGWAMVCQSFDASLVERLINRYAENEPENSVDSMTCLKIVSEQTGMTYDAIQNRINVLLKANDLM